MEEKSNPYLHDFLTLSSWYITYIILIPFAWFNSKKQSKVLPRLWAELWAVGSHLYTAVNAFTQSNYPAFPASSCWSSTALMSYGTTVPCCITGGWSHKYKRHITWSSFFFLSAFKYKSLILICQKMFQSFVFLPFYFCHLFLFISEH